MSTLPTPGEWKSRPSNDGSVIDIYAEQADGTVVDVAFCYAGHEADAAFIVNARRNAAVGAPRWLNGLAERRAQQKDARHLRLIGKAEITAAIQRMPSLSHDEVLSILLLLADKTTDAEQAFALRAMQLDETPDDDVLPALRDPLELDAQYRYESPARAAGMGGCDLVGAAA